jgi:hypothetical protein
MERERDLEREREKEREKERERERVLCDGERRPRCGWMDSDAASGPGLGCSGPARPGERGVTGWRPGAAAGVLAERDSPRRSSDGGTDSEARHGGTSF